MRKVFVCLALISIIFISFSEHKELPVITCQKVKSIEYLSDSSFFSDVRCLVGSEKSIYFSDYKRSQVIELAKSNLSVTGITGRYGIGPGEVNGLDGFFLKKDTIFASNDQKRCIEVFLKGKHLRTIKLPEEIHDASFHTRFFIYKNTFYFSVGRSSNPIAAFDYKTSEIKKTSQPYVFSDKIQERVRNNRHLLLYNNSIIVSISDNLPIIETYNLDGSPINKYDFSEIPIIKKRNNYTAGKQKTSAPNSFYVLVEDSYISDDHLFLLLYKGDTKTSCNKILVFKITNNNFLPEKIIDLGEGWFDGICVSGNKIWTSDTLTNTIIEFNADGLNE